MKIYSRVLGLLTLCVSMFILTSCDDTESYSDLLRDEEHAVNWFLADHKVELEIPADNKFIIGEDAPYYKMDVDGNVYMQVLDMGDLENKPEKGDKVFFRFMRRNIKRMYQGESAAWSGNADDMNSSLGTTSLVYGNSYLSSSTQYGDGLQVPLEYLGYNCHVNLIVKSTEGWSSDITACTPYVYNIRYFKAEY